MMATILPFPEQGAAMPARSSRDAAPSAEEDWSQLMAQAQAGDRDAYRRLLHAVTPYLRAIARRHLGADEVDDAVQEILIVVHDIRHTYEPGRPFKPWLSTIASRRCIDLLRRRMTRLGHEADMGIDDIDVVEPSPGPEALALRDDAATRLRREVDRLPPHQRRAVTRVHLDEHGLGDAAAESGQSAGSLKVACHRALKSLRQALKKLEDA